VCGTCFFFCAWVGSTHEIVSFVVLRPERVKGLARLFFGARRTLPASVTIAFVQRIEQP